MSISSPIGPTPRPWFTLEKTPLIWWLSSGVPASRLETRRGKVLRPGPEKTKSRAGTLRIHSPPDGVSEVAPPSTVRTFGLRSLILRAVAKETMFSKNMEVKPTMSARSSSQSASSLAGVPPRGRGIGGQVVKEPGGEARDVGAVELVVVDQLVEHAVELAALLQHGAQERL